MTDIRNPVARRAFVTGLGVGAAALGAGLAACATAEEKPVPATAAAAAVAPVAPARWQPVYNAQDDWMELPGIHRIVFDSLSPDGAGHALVFASNYLGANKDGYKLEPSDLATIVIMRHFATPFGYTDAMWAKYGAIWGKLLKHKDPKTKKIALRNTLNTVSGPKPSPEDVTLPMLIEKGVHFAICGAATQFIAGEIAKKTGGKAADIYAELAANLIPNSHMVAAGIVAVNRTQERGYAFSYVG